MNTFAEKVLRGISKLHARMGKSRKNADEHFTHNAQFTFIGAVNGQAKGNAAVLKMGGYTADRNGCGWIAVYNAMLICGEACAPAEVIRYFEQRGGLLFNGAWGANPVSLKQWFLEKGYFATLHAFPKAADGIAAKSDACIVNYWTGKGTHYIAVCPKDGKFLMYNVYNNDKTHRTVGSIDEWMADNKKKYLDIIALIKPD